MHGRRRARLLSKAPTYRNGPACFISATKCSWRVCRCAISEQGAQRVEASGAQPLQLHRIHSCRHRLRSGGEKRSLHKYLLVFYACRNLCVTKGIYVHACTCVQPMIVYSPSSGVEFVTSMSRILKTQAAVFKIRLLLKVMRDVSPSGSSDVVLCVPFTMAADGAVTSYTATGSEPAVWRLVRASAGVYLLFQVHRWPQRRLVFLSHTPQLACGAVGR